MKIIYLNSGVKNYMKIKEYYGMLWHFLEWSIYDIADNRFF